MTSNASELLQKTGHGIEEHTRLCALVYQHPHKILSTGTPKEVLALLREEIPSTVNRFHGKSTLWALAFAWDATLQTFFRPVLAELQKLAEERQVPLFEEGSIPEVHPSNSEEEIINWFHLATEQDWQQTLVHVFPEVWFFMAHHEAMLYFELSEEEQTFLQLCLRHKPLIHTA